MNILSRFSTSLRKCAPFLLCFCLLLCCTACAAPRHQTEDRLQAIQKRGYLEVCTEPYLHRLSLWIPPSPATRNT